MKRRVSFTKLLVCVFLISIITTCLSMTTSFAAKANVPNGIYKITVKHTGKVLDVRDVSKETGAVVHQWDYVGGQNQHWRVEAQNDGYYKITAVHSGKVLDVSDSSKNDGTRIQQWDSNGSDAQRWSFEQNGSYVRIVSKVSGKGLEVAGGHRSNGDVFTQWTLHGFDHQKFTLSKVGNTSAPSNTNSGVNQSTKTSATAPSVNGGRARWNDRDGDGDADAVFVYDGNVPLNSLRHAADQIESGSDGKIDIQIMKGTQTDAKK